jgi:hypothetical protein
MSIAVPYVTLRSSRPAWTTQPGRLYADERLAAGEHRLSVYSVGTWLQAVAVGQLSSGSKYTSTTRQAKQQAPPALLQQLEQF